MAHFTPEAFYATVSALLFAGFILLTLSGAIMAAVASRLIRSVSGLALCFLGLAGLYYYLNNPFLALMQILIYVGAICVTIMFAIMLAEITEAPRPFSKTLWLSIGTMVAAAAVTLPLILVIRTSAWVSAPAVKANAGTIQDLGRALLTRFGFAFELISVVLLLAILGALVVARSGRGAK